MAEAAVIVIYGGIATAFLIRRRDKLFFWSFIAAGSVTTALLQLIK